jgi:membrane protein
VRELYDRFDCFQRRHAWLGFPLAVRQKFSEDQGGYLAACITYYAFFSLFPLLLVATTVLGFVTRGHPGLERSIERSALGQFPLIGDQLRSHSLHGSALALVIGSLLALWSGMGVFLAAQNAMNHVWDVPHERRPDFLRQRLRALALLLVFGGGALATTVLASLGTFGAAYGLFWKVGSVALSALLDFGLFWLGFRTLTVRDVSWSQLWRGAAVAALLYELLQTLGGYYVGHVLRNASNTYGTFALVIALLSWIYLAVHAILLAAESNVVAVRRLWPRSFSVVFERPPTEADRLALAARAEVEEQRSGEEIEVTVDGERPPAARQ